jgi:hypothetical protein
MNVVRDLVAQIVFHFRLNRSSSSASIISGSRRFGGETRDGFDIAAKMIDPVADG